MKPKLRLFLGVAAPLLSALINPRGFHDGQIFTLLGSAEWFAPFIFFMLVVGCGATLGSVLLADQPRWSEVLAGALLAAAAAAVIATVLFLLSIVMNVLYAPHLIFFAVVPPLAGYVWLRTGLALLRESAPTEFVVVRWGAAKACLTCLDSGFVAMALAALLLTHALDVVATGNLGDAKQAALVIRSAPWCFTVCNDSISLAYRTSEDVQRRQLLDDLYLQRNGYGVNEANMRGYW